VALACAILALAFVGSAAAADPDAPPGAPASWLPHDPWVQDHWLPYDETRLYAVLHTTRTDILQWLGERHDRVPLTVFAREQGVPVAGLAQRLVGPRPRTMSVSLYSLLVYRAGKTLTQPHLAHHMLGHVFHVQPLNRFMRTALGLPGYELVQMHRGEGLSWAQIAQRQRLNPNTLARRILALLRETEDEGVALGQTPPSQAQRWLALQDDRFTRYFFGAPQAEPGVPFIAEFSEATLYCHLLT
jgi:hypothetical protein